MAEEGGVPAGSGSGRRVAGRSPKFWTVAGLSVLGVVVFLQNSETAKVHVLFWTVDLPLVFLLLVMVGLGIGVDRLWLWRQRRR